MNENIVIKTENFFDEFVENSQGSSCDDAYTQFVSKVSTGNAQKRQLQQQPPPSSSSQTHLTQQGSAAKVPKLSPNLASSNNNNNHTNNTTDDVKLRNVLKLFDLEILYSTLKLGDITYRSLPYIAVDDINMVIRHIGYRAEFREKLFAWRKEKVDTADTPVVRPAQAIAPTTRPVAKTTPTTSIVAPTMTGPPATFLNAVPSLNAATTNRYIPERNAAEEFLSLLPGVSSSTVLGTTAATVVLDEAVELEEPLSLLPSTSRGHNSTPKTVVSFNSSKVNVQSILDSNHIGQTIKQMYTKTGYLENSQRKEIVRIIIEEVMQQGISLSPKDFRVILDDIIKVFPNEKAASDYYFIYRNGKGNPLGRLYQRYSNENSKRRRLTRLAEGEEDCSDGDRQSSLMDDDETVAYPSELPGRVPKVDEMTALALKQLLTTDHFSWEEVCDRWIR